MGALLIAKAMQAVAKIEEIFQTTKMDTLEYNILKDFLGQPVHF